MKATIKKKWLKALRSGEYQQGKYWLKKADSFCCLGVLCDIHAKETKDYWCREDEKYNGEVWSLDGYPDHLPPKVIEWAGLKVSHGASVEVDFEDNGIRTLSLPELNDDYGRSFKEIADLIEEQL